MLTLEPVAFLQGIPPFQLLDEPTLGCFAHCLSLEFYPKGFPILTQGGPASDSLQVVRTGGAKVAENIMVCRSGCRRRTRSPGASPRPCTRG